jgi:two-component system, LytTR family, response regulator
MLKCIIVDDEQSAIAILKKHVAAMGQLHLVHATTKPLEALRIINEQPIDIAFLDIKMPGITGLELAAVIQGKCKVIFTTAYSEFAMDTYDLDADVLDYLLKPIPLPRFIRAVERAIKKITPLETAPPATVFDNLDHDYLFVKNEEKGKMTRVMLAHIDYVQAMKKQVTIYHGGQITIAKLGMKDIEERLPARHFIRVQKSFIVALHKIDTVEGNWLRLKGFDIPIGIGDIYRPQFMEAMKGKLIK